MNARDLINERDVRVERVDWRPRRLGKVGGRAEWVYVVQVLDATGERRLVA